MVSVGYAPEIVCPHSYLTVVGHVDLVGYSPFVRRNSRQLVQAVAQLFSPRHSVGYFFQEILLFLKSQAELLGNLHVIRSTNLTVGKHYSVDLNETPNHFLGRVDATNRMGLTRGVLHDPFARRTEQ